MDPASAGRNWYAYCDNNPLAEVDPTGLHGEEGKLPPGFKLPSGRRVVGFTGHALDQIIGRDGGRGVKNWAILQAMREGAEVPARGGAIKVVGKNATLIVSAEGRVITAYGTSKWGIRLSSSGATVGALMTMLWGADALFKSVGTVGKYRKRMDKHTAVAWGDEGANDGADQDEGVEP